MNERFFGLLIGLLVGFLIGAFAIENKTEKRVLEELGYTKKIIKNNYEYIKK